MILKLKTIIVTIIISIVSCTGSLAEDSQKKFFEPFIRHLGFFGYEANLNETIAIAKHPRWVNVNIRKYNRGIVFTSLYYSCKPEAKNNRLDFQKFINNLNADFTVSKAVIDEDVKVRVLFVAWYPGSYDKKRFTVFLDSWNHDTSISIYKDRQMLMKYLN